MPLGTAEIVLFAIRAGLRLAQASRKAYVEATQDLVLTLPLPSPFLPANLGMAQKIRNLLAALRPLPGGTPDPTYVRFFLKPGGTSEADEKTGEALVLAYLEYLGSGGWGGAKSEFGPAAADYQDRVARDLCALATVRQWDKSPNPSALQRVGGALVEVAVDYFVNVPGALDERSKYTKTIRTFLQGMEDANFQEGRWDTILLSVFSAGLETLTQHPEIISGEDEKSPLLRTIVSGVLQDIKVRLDDIRENRGDEFTAAETFERVGASVLTGLITGSSRAVLDNPEVLGLSQPQQQNLVQGVGRALLEIMSQDLKPENSGNQELKALASGFRRLASTGGIEKLIHAALKVAAENPGLVGTGDTTADNWLQHVITDLYRLYPKNLQLFQGNKTIDPELFSNIAYLLLSNGIQDLQPLLLEKVGPNQGALLTEVATTVLGHVAETPQAGQPVKWRLRLTESDVRTLVSGVLRAIGEHPEWLSADPKVKGLVPDATAVLCDWLLQDADGSYGQQMKALIRSEAFPNLVAAVFTSGLIPLDKQALADFQENASVLKGALQEILQRVTENGVSGLGELAAYGTLHDLFLVLNNARFVRKLTDGTKAQRKTALAQLDAVLEALKSGQAVTMKQMETTFKEAA